MADGIPRQIGRYKILGEIGRGGFGRVYRALDPTVGRPVAIKILTEATEDIVDRFHHEAMVAGNLRHKNIVIVYDYGDHEGQPFLSMEYLEGHTIQELIVSQKPLSLLEKCNIMAQVADGLHHAHRSGVIHRDVKPGNVMVLPDGSAKIMDFGIARVISDQETRLTRQGSVIGTISYMSPEQFSGTMEVDALCDIFAFGVSWYEFLTGHHPFEATDARAMMYKITFEEPLPIRDFIEDFPESLQRVISRTLAKDRDLRYPSLQEVQFDLEPIRIELQRQRAGSLLLQAQDLFEKGQLDPAQNVVLEVLTLDPSNTVARSLYETVQKKIRHRTLQPRVEATLKSGEEQLEKRRFADAVKSFEAALKLDLDNLYIQNRISHARGLLEHSKAAAALLSEARQQLSKQNLTAAYRCVTEALQHDPNLQEATELLGKVQVVMALRQREQRVEDALQKADSLRLLSSYVEATAALTALRAEADDPRVRRLLTQILSEQAEQERQSKLRNQMAKATDLLRERRWLEAVELLQNVTHEFADNAEVSSLLSYAQKELEAETRAKAVEKASAEARTHVDAQNYDAALALLEAELQRYPGEDAVMRLLDSTIKAKGHWELDQLVQRVTVESQGLRSGQRFPEAIEVVEAALRAHPAEPRLTALLDSLENAWTEYRRVQTVRRAIDQAQGFLSSKQPDGAVQVLQPILAQYPDEAALSDLLGRAREELRAQEKARALDAIREQAGRFVDANDFERAREAVDSGLTTFPAEPTLVELRDQVSHQRKVWERRQAISAILTKATALQSARSFPEAAQLIEAALRDYSSEPALTQFADKLNQAWEQHKRSEAIRKISRDARELLFRRQSEEADELLDQALRTYPNEPELEQVASLAKQAIQDQQRQFAIQLAIEQAQELVTGQDFERARQVLEDNLKQYPGEPELVRQSEAVAAARRDWEHAAEVQSAIKKATQFAAAEQFESALETLAGALRDPPQEPALIEARRRIEAEFEAYRRRLAIATARKDATSMLDRGYLDEAMELLRDVAGRYPDGDWHTLLGRAEQEIETRKQAEEKARTVAAIERDATDLAIRRQFDAALKLVAQGLSQYSGDPTLTECQKGIHFAHQQQERAAAIERGARAITQHLDQERFDEALRLIEKAGRDYPGEEIFGSLRTRYDQAIQARRRRDEAARDGELLVEERRFVDAVELLERALIAKPADPQLTSIRDRARKLQKEAQDREDGIRQAVSAIQTLAQQGQFGEGLTRAEGALKTYGDEPRIVRLRDEMRMRKGLADARTLLEQTRPDEALRLIEETSAGFAALHEVKGLTKRAREQQQALARSAAISAEVKKAKGIIDAGDLEQGLAVLGEGLRQWPDAAPLIELRDSVLQEQAARERHQAVENAILECETLRQENRLDTALQCVQTLLRQLQDEPALIQLKDRIEGELRERERHESRKRSLQEVKNIAAQSQTVTSPSEITEMLASLAQVMGQHPSDVEICDAADEVKRYLESIEQARRKLTEGDFAGVIEAADRHLRKSPDQALFSGLKKEAENRLRLAYLRDIQQRVESEPDLEKRVGLLEQSAARYPDEARTVGELAVTRNKLSLVNGVLERAREAEQSGDWEAALREWKSLTTIHEQQPNLKAEIERVQRMQEQARRQAIQASVLAIEGYLSVRDLTKAEESLRQAERKFPGVARFGELGKELESTKKKAARARELYAQAEKALKSDWKKAEALLNEADALGSGLSPPEELLRAVGQKKKESDIGALVKTANQSRTSGDFRAALATIQEGLVKYPDESRLLLLADSIKQELRSRRDALVSELAQIQKSVETEAELPQVEAFLQRSTAISVENQQDAEIGALATQTTAGIKARIRQLKRDQLLGRLLGYRKPLAAAVMALLLGTAGWFGAKAVLRATREVPVKLSGTLAGISVDGGGKHCVTPDCTLSFKPGRYNLTVKKAGYKTLHLPVIVEANQPGVDVPLTLDPLPTLLQVNTNFANGRVSIDRGPLTPLINGALSVSGLPDGAHTIRVTDGNAEFQARWRTTIGEKPQLTGPMVARDVDATVLGNIGSTGAIACNCGEQQVTVDGTPAGRITETPSEMGSLPEGVRKIGIGGRSILLDVKPNPTLSIILALDRNVGTLVIETGMPNAKVFLNNQARGETSGQDVLRMPVAVGTYSVRVEKNGYQASVQTVDVGKGEEKRVTVALTPVQASLEIKAALPGAQVMLDGHLAGQTDASGTFRAQGLTATKHSIDLSKDGYAPARLETLLAAGTTTRVTGSQFNMSKVVPTTPRVDPTEIEALDWSRVRNSTNPDELDAFIRGHSGGAHVEEARNRATRLRQDATQAKAARESGAAAEAAWANLDKTKKAGVQDYLSRFPTGSHASEARAVMGRLEKQEEDARLERARIQAEQERLQNANDEVALQQQAITRTLANYEAAYNKLSLPELRAIWTDMPEETAQTIGRQFQISKAVLLQLRPAGPATLDGNSASVTCSRTLTFTPKDSHKPILATDRVRVMLTRSPGGWVIRSITHS